MVLRDLNFSLHKGEFVTVIGPNGCGKSTMMQVLAGLLPFDSGSVQVDGALPQDVPIGLIFQNYRESLLPWYSAIDNIAFPLQVKGMGRKDRREQVRAFAAELGMTVPFDRRPYQLSGGQQQLVSILRSVIAAPRLLLMDEPFSSLDYRARRSMHQSLQQIFAQTGQTVLFVSHDVEEAILLADRVLVLSAMPATVVREFPVGLPRPRTEELVVEDKFLAIKRNIFDCFTEVLKKTEAS
jgi:NitT/TauT family transport system ATP-binding protein